MLPPRPLLELVLDSSPPPYPAESGTSLVSADAGYFEDAQLRALVAPTALPAPPLVPAEALVHLPPPPRMPMLSLVESPMPSRPSRRPTVRVGENRKNKVVRLLRPSRPPPPSLPPPGSATVKTAA